MHSPGARPGPMHALAGIQSSDGSVNAWPAAGAACWGATALQPKWKLCVCVLRGGEGGGGGFPEGDTRIPQFLRVPQA